MQSVHQKSFWMVSRVQHCWGCWGRASPRDGAGTAVGQEEAAACSGSLSPAASGMCFLPLCPTPPCRDLGRAEASHPPLSPWQPQSPPCSQPCPPQAGTLSRVLFWGVSITLPRSCGADCRNMGFSIIFSLTWLDRTVLRGGYEFNYAVGLEALGIKERLFQRSNWMLIWGSSSSLWSAPKGKGNIVSSIYCGIYNINDLKNTLGISVRCLF